MMMGKNKSFIIKKESILLILLGLSFLFTLAIPSFVVWDFPRIPEEGLNVGIGDFSVASVAIVQATSLFIFDIFLKITILIYLFKK